MHFFVYNKALFNGWVHSTYFQVTDVFQSDNNFKRILIGHHIFSLLGQGLYYNSFDRRMHIWKKNIEHAVNRANVSFYYLFWMYWNLIFSLSISLNSLHPWRLCTDSMYAKLIDIIPNPVVSTLMNKLDLWWICVAKSNRGVTESLLKE